MLAKAVEIVCARDLGVEWHANYESMMRVFLRLWWRFEFHGVR